MPCFHPMAACRMSDGSVKFVSKHKHGVEAEILLPCGQCVGCRLERSRQWAIRCMHEASLHEQNCFVTLTYAPEHLPPGASLDYSDFQKFMKRLRKKINRKITFYVGGEYGESVGNRPHFHVCLFGYDFPDRKHLKRSDSGENLYTSAILSDLWPYGICSVGNVSFKSAAYIARYCMKKVNGQLAELHYSTDEFVDRDGVIRTSLTPEFNHMSLKPAVGKRWLEKYQTDVFPRDYVVVNGIRTKVPKYYDALFEKDNPVDFAEITALREFNAYGQFLRGEQSPERLAAKETVTLARTSQLVRGLSS